MRARERERGRVEGSEGEMADHQRIHPVEMDNQESVHAAVEVTEASSTSEPLPPSGSARSTKDEAGNDLPSQLPPPPSATADGAAAAEPATPSSEAPTTNRQYGKYLRWCYWIFLILFILFLLLCTFFALLLLIFRPKPPHYYFNNLRITSFSITPTANTTTISASFDLQVTIRNPNKHVGIYYERGSNVSVWNANTSLCTGVVPKFYQGGKNTTVLHVLLRGEAQLGQAEMQALQGVWRTRQIPLQVRARVPLKLKFGRLKLWKMRFSGRCDFQVNNLNSGSVISIRGSHCHGIKKKFI